jgi:hypothetical protein
MTVAEELFGFLWFPKLYPPQVIEDIYSTEFGVGFPASMEGRDDPEKDGIALQEGSPQRLFVA